MFKKFFITAALIAACFVSTEAQAQDVDYNKAYRVYNWRTGELLSTISFEPEVVWINGNPYVSMKEFDCEDRMYNNLYDYNDIMLHPIDPKNIIKGAF